MNSSKLLLREFPVKDGTIGEGSIELVDHGVENAGPRYTTWFMSVTADCAYLTHYFDELLEAEMDWMHRCERGW